MINRNIIITGALGQDGKLLSEILIKKNYKIIGCIKKKKYNDKIKKVIYISVNLNNKKEVRDILKKYNPTKVIHFGSENPSFINNNKKNFFYKKNYNSTKNLIDCINHFNSKIHFIFASSSNIFLKKKINKYTESDIFYENDSYSRFRIKTYDYLKKLNLNGDFTYTNLILFNHDSALRNNKFLLPRIVSAIKNNDQIFLNDIYKENIIRDFSHAEDICKAIYLLIKNKNYPDNLILSSSKKTKINSIINYLLHKYNNSIKISSKPKNNTNYMIGDNKLAKKILNWRPMKNIFIAADEIYNK